MNDEDEKTLTLALRTRENLEFIYNKKEIGEKVQEFTQLLNSMLGMVISLREDYFKGSHIDWKDIEELGLLEKRENLKNIVGEKATKISPNLQQINSFSQLITKVRNAFAHNCFELIKDNKSKQIIGVTIWNINIGQKNITINRVWEAYFSEQNLKDLAYLIVEYLEKELG